MSKRLKNSNALNMGGRAGVSSQLPATLQDGSQSARLNYGGNPGNFTARNVTHQKKNLLGAKEDNYVRGSGAATARTIRSTTRNAMKQGNSSNSQTRA